MAFLQLLFYWSCSLRPVCHLDERRQHQLDFSSNPGTLPSRTPTGPLKAQAPGHYSLGHDTDKMAYLLLLFYWSCSLRPVCHLTKGRQHQLDFSSNPETLPSRTPTGPLKVQAPGHYLLEHGTDRMAYLLLQFYLVLLFAPAVLPGGGSPSTPPLFESRNITTRTPMGPLKPKSRVPTHWGTTRTGWHSYYCCFTWSYRLRPVCHLFENRQHQLYFSSNPETLPSRTPTGPLKAQALGHYSLGHDTDRMVYLLPLFYWSCSLRLVCHLTKGRQHQLYLSFNTVTLISKTAAGPLKAQPPLNC